MKRRLAFVILIILISCTRDKIIKPVQSNQVYKGTGVVYFRFPISGSNYQMTFIPCKKVITNLDEIKSSDFGHGSIIWINNREWLTKIYEKKRQIHPINYSKEPDPYQRVLNYFNAYIEMNVGPQRFGLVNDTIYLNRRLLFKYIVPEDVTIDSLEIIN
ncbi:hypothetical protein [Arcticibacter tournemirensis]